MNQLILNETDKMFLMHNIKSDLFNFLGLDKKIFNETKFYIDTLNYYFFSIKYHSNNMTIREVLRLNEKEPYDCFNINRTMICYLDNESNGSIRYESLIKNQKLNINHDKKLADLSDFSVEDKIHEVYDEDAFLEKKDYIEASSITTEGSSEVKRFYQQSFYLNDNSNNEMNYIVLKNFIKYYLSVKCNVDAISPQHLNRITKAVFNQCNSKEIKDSFKCFFIPSILDSIKDYIITEDNLIINESIIQIEEYMTLNYKN